MQKYACRITLAFALAALAAFMPGAAAGEPKEAPAATGKTGATDAPLTAQWPVRGVITFPFELDRNFDYQPDEWIRYYDKEHLPRVTSSLENVDGGRSKSLEFKLAHGPAVIYSRRFIHINAHVTYRLEVGIRTTGMKTSTACAEIVFFNKDFEEMPEFTARTREVGGTIDRFRRVSVVVENLGRLVKYARIRLIVNGSFEDFHSDEKPCWCAFDDVELREFPRTFISGKTMLYKGEKSRVKITTSSLNTGGFTAREEYFDYRLRPIPGLTRVTKFIKEDRTPHFAESSFNSDNAGFFIYTYTVNDSSGQLVTQSRKSYVVIERKSQIRSVDFGVGVDPAIQPKMVEQFLDSLGTGIMLLDLPSTDDKEKLKALDRLRQYTFPGISKVGSFKIKNSLTATDEKVKARRKKVTDILAAHAADYADELMQWLIYPEDPSLLARTELEPLMNMLMAPIKAVKRASRIGLILPRGEAPSKLPKVDMNIYVREVGALDNLDKVTPNETGCRWVILDPPLYDPAHHHDRIGAIARSVIMFRKNGFEKIFVRHLTDDKIGLLGENGELRPSYLAFRTLVRLLDSAVEESLIDPATGKPFTIHPDAHTYIFRMKSNVSEDGNYTYLLAAWVDEGEAETSVYLGNRLVRHRLLGGSSPLANVEDRTKITLTKTPVIVTGINMALLRFILNLKFETEDVPCRLDRQEVKFSFTNYFDNAFDGTFGLKFPPEWQADPTTFTFENVSPGEKMNASLVLSIPLNATIATKDIGFNISLFMHSGEKYKKTVDKKPSYSMRITRPLSLSSVIDAEITYMARSKIGPALRIKIKSKQDFPIDLYAYIRLEGQPPPPDERVIRLAARGENEILYRVNIRKDAGKKVSIGLRQSAGDYFYNTEFKIPKK